MHPGFLEEEVILVVGIEVGVALCVIGDSGEVRVLKHEDGIVESLKEVAGAPVLEIGTLRSEVIVNELFTWSAFVDDDL